MTEKAEELLGENREGSTARTTDPHPAHGRVLDYQIAIRVFGARLFMRGGPFLDDVPHYSTRIEAAWEVVERMHSLGFTVAVILDTGDEEPSCEIAKPEWQGSEVWSGETAPLAICIAALKALEA